jgi:hypothetical protein
MNINDKLRHITPQELAQLGIQDLAYVKRVIVEDETAFGVYAADGTQVALLPDQAVAFAAIRQNEMQPVSVH